MIQKERITRAKHDWGKLGDLDLYLERLPVDRGAVDLVVECYSSDDEIAHRARYRRELTRRMGGVEVAAVSHHLAHAYSAFFPSGMTEAAVMVIDFQGSRFGDLTERLGSPCDAAPTDVEVASFYMGAGRALSCVDKHLWDRDLRRPVGLGAFYFFLTRALFPGRGHEGKVMGLAPFGDPRALGLPALVVSGPRVFIPAAWYRVFDDPGFRHRAGDAAQFKKSADLAAAGQHAFEEALLALARWLARTTGLRKLCFAGGIALNCAANGRLLRETPFTEIFIPPAPHDGGTALGCALYGQLALRGRMPRFRWRDDFLGPRATRLDVADARMRGLIVERPIDLALAAAERIARREVVAVFQGRSESGPRALGHRSIFADARVPGMCDWINARIKGREPFRPVAPIVLAEHAHAWFEVDRPLSFMQFAVAVRRRRRTRIPSVTHIDGSARIQTVASGGDPLVRAMLEAFHGITGVPMFINTSLNGPGEPLVETAEEALALFLKTPMHALIAPPWLVRKRESPPLPE